MICQAVIARRKRMHLGRSWSLLQSLLVILGLWNRGKLLLGRKQAVGSTEICHSVSVCMCVWQVLWQNEAGRKNYNCRKGDFGKKNASIFLCEIIFKLHLLMCRKSPTFSIKSSEDRWNNLRLHSFSSQRRCLDLHMWMKNKQNSQPPN